MAGSDATTVRRPVLRALRRRSGDVWDQNEVATYLMAFRGQIVQGLARRTPWVGIDDETLDSCFAHAAAVVVKVAVSGQKKEWRTPKDLEKALVAAYRNQAFDYWKRVNAQSRQGERFTVAFDPDLHASKDAPIERIFEQPDLHGIERDLLAEVDDVTSRAFWTIVLREHATFKQAGDLLGLTKAGVAVCTRAGRTLFAHYLERRASGALCRDRSSDILAIRAGLIEPRRAERAAAHMECCYACALVHEPSTSAIQRGMLGLAPTGLILRMLSRAGDVAATPVMRIADTGSGSRAVAAGLAAVAVGAGAGAGVVTREEREPPVRSKRPPVERRSVPSAAGPTREPRPGLVPPVSAVASPSRPPKAVRKPLLTARSTKKAGPRPKQRGRFSAVETQGRTSAIEAQEFSPEVVSKVATTPPPVTEPLVAPGPAAQEFGTP